MSEPGRLGRQITRLRPFGPLIAVTGVAAFLRLWALGTNPPTLWDDEITGFFTPYLILHGLAGSAQWSLLHQPTSSPTEQLAILFSSAVQGPLWSSASGVNSPLAVRTPVAVFGTLTVVVLYYLGMEVKDQRVGIVAAAFGAVAPWELYYSRFAVPGAAMEFLSLLALLLALRGFRTKSRRTLTASVVTGTLVAYTHVSGIAVVLFLFIPLWIAIAFLLIGRPRSLPSVPRYLLDAFWRTSPEIGGSVLLLAPIILLQLGPSGSVLSTGTFIWQFCPSIGCTASHFATATWWSWSPDFLAFSGGLAGAQAASSQFHISTASVWGSGGGLTGMLTPLGLLVYPAIALQLCLLGRRGPRYVLGLTTIFLALSYSVVGGVVYYDNPNAARLAFASGVFVLLIAFLLIYILDLIVSTLPKLVRLMLGSARTHTDSVDRPMAGRYPRRTTRTLFQVLTTLVAIALVGAIATPYVLGYFNDYPTISNQYISPEIQDIARALSSNDLWGFPTFVKAPSNLYYIVPAELGFFDIGHAFSWPIDSFTSSVQAQPEVYDTYNESVYISLVGPQGSNLTAVGAGFTTIEQSSELSVYVVYGPAYNGAELAAIGEWDQSPELAYQAQSLKWVVVNPISGGDFHIAESNQSLQVTVTLNSTAGEGQWLGLQASISSNASPVDFPILHVNWSLVSNASSTSAMNLIEGLAENGSTYVAQSDLNFPGQYANVLAGSSSPAASNYSFIQIGIHLAPGSTVVADISNLTLYGLTGTTAPSSSAQQIVLEGSAAQYGFVKNGKLVVNAAGPSFRFTLNTPGVPTSGPSFARIQLSVADYLSENLTVTLHGEGVNLTVTSSGQPLDQEFSIYFPLPFGYFDQYRVLTLSLTTIGLLEISSVELGFYPLS
jgi:hypothetical protein